MESAAALRDRIDAQVVENLIKSLDTRLDDIISELMEAYRARIPSYAAAPEDFMEEVHLGTTTSYRVGLEILKGQVDPDFIRGPLEELGRRRCTQGIPLGDALLAWQISMRTFWVQIVDLAPTDPSQRSDVMLLTSAVMGELMEQAVSAISNGYLAVERDRVTDEEFDSQVAVETLSGERPRDDLFESAIARLGIDTTALRYCVVTELDENDVGGTIRWLRSHLAGAVGGRIEGFAVAFCASDPEIERFQPVGIAQVGADDSGYRNARAALKVSLALQLPSARYEDVAPLALILDAPEQERASFVEAQLGPVVGDQSASELLRSLAAYYSAGQSVASAARDLHVHRHTLEYRLERLEKLLGRRMKDPTGRLLLELALTLREPTEDGADTQS